MAWHYAYSQDLWPAMISVALLKLTIVSRRSRWPVAFMLLGLLSGRVMYVLDSLDNQVFSPGESVLVVIGLSCSVRRDHAIRRRY